MLMSGWILPDGSYIHCNSSSNMKEHIECVKKYLKGLGDDEYSKIIQTIDKMSLDDFAVKKLGWIKVINEPAKYVFYPRMIDLDFLEIYERYGYILIEI